MISLIMSLTVSPVCLIFISGAVAQYPWDVYYNPKSICALKGSTVTSSCIYTYPRGHSVQVTFWSKELVTDKEPPDLSDDPEYRDRVHYLGDNQHDCTLKLNNVTEKDQRKYYFRFITDNGGKYQGPDGVDLSVTDLQVEVPERVMEGDKVALTCKTTCNLTGLPTFTWYRNGYRLSSRTEQLHLQKVSSEDTGRYLCAVRGQKSFSPEVTFDVRYPPKNISVSISPSVETVDDSSVTLTCNSDANPPVQNYTWFKEGGSSPVGSGHSYSALQSGSFYCVAQNKYGSQRSATVTVRLKEVKNTLMYALTGAFTGAVAGAVVSSAVLGCGCLPVVIAVLYVRRKKRSGLAMYNRQGNLHRNETLRSSINETSPDPDLSSQDEVHYASIEFQKNSRKAKNSAVRSSAFRTDEEVQYSSVQHSQ